jgi:hypothetical protein
MVNPLLAWVATEMMPLLAKLGQLFCEVIVIMGWIKTFTVTRIERAKVPFEAVTITPYWPSS